MFIISYNVFYLERPVPTQGPQKAGQFLALAVTIHSQCRKPSDGGASVAPNILAWLQFTFRGKTSLYFILIFYYIIIIIVFWKWHTDCRELCFLAEIALFAASSCCFLLSIGWAAAIGVLSGGAPLGQGGQYIQQTSLYKD